jgi:hypothetical protein
VVVRAIVATSLVTLLAGNASGSTGSAPNCREGAIVSAKTGKVLQRFSARGGGA